MKKKKKQIKNDDFKMYYKSNDFILQIEMDYFKGSQFLEKGDQFKFEYIGIEMIINYLKGFFFGQLVDGVGILGVKK